MTGPRSGRPLGAAQAGSHLVPSRASRGRLSTTRDELERWGAQFGRAARPPLVTAISGPLGAGKTTLAQAICRGYGVADAVTSPTYALVHEYTAPRSRVFHIDLYRLNGPEELVSLGWEEIMAAHALILVEWPERAGDRLPPGHVPIDLEYVPGDDARRFLLAG